MTTVRDAFAFAQTSATVKSRGRVHQQAHFEREIFIPSPAGAASALVGGAAPARSDQFVVIDRSAADQDNVATQYTRQAMRAQESVRQSPPLHADDI